MHAHRRRGDLLRQIEKGRVERSPHEAGPFDQVREHRGEIGVGVDPSPDLRRQAPGGVEDRDGNGVSIDPP